MGKVDRCFEYSECRNLKSLEGTPEEVEDDFDCSWCDNLTSLKGAPETVGGGNFNCSWSKNLTSLEGAPKEVSGDFICINHWKLKITDSDRKKYKIKS